MAELNARIIAKASATAAEEPLAGDLEVAELAVNTADGKLFTKHTDGSVVTISGGGGGGAVDSVNGETGVVSLGIQEMDDYEAIGYAYVSTWNNSAGQWVQLSSRIFQIAEVDNDGNDLNAQFSALQVGDQIGLRVSAESEINYYEITTPAPARTNLAAGPGFKWTIYVAADLPAYADTHFYLGGPEEGDVLTWVGADSRWKPIAPSASETRALLGIGEYVDDAAAGTGGVASGAMYYNTTSSDYRSKS